MTSIISSYICIPYVQVFQIFFLKRKLINLNLKLFKYTLNYLNDIICDFHTLPKKSNAKYCICDNNFWGFSVVMPQQGDWKNVKLSKVLNARI